MEKQTSSWTKPRYQKNVEKTVCSSLDYKPSMFCYTAEGFMVMWKSEILQSVQSNALKLLLGHLSSQDDLWCFSHSWSPRLQIVEQILFYNDTVENSSVGLSLGSALNTFMWRTLCTTVFASKHKMITECTLTISPAFLHWLPLLFRIHNSIWSMFVFFLTTGSHLLLDYPRSKTWADISRPGWTP